MINKQKKSVLVIGAGISGLASASILHDSGYDVTILEARNRIGGRIWTSHQWPEIPVDLGASWIHGTQKNPLTELSNHLGVRRVSTDYGNNILYGMDGNTVNSSYQYEIDHIFNQLMKFTHKNALDNEVIFEVIQRSHLWIELSKKQQQFINHMMNTKIEHELAGSVNEISAINSDDSKTFAGNDVIFPDGYIFLAKYLANKVNIKLEHIVKKIDYTTNKIKVITNGGCFITDQVIVTLPIGVLQRHSVKFEPPLPLNKQKAISMMGAGLLDKLFLKFPYIFWDKEREFLNWISSEHGRWNEWFNISVYSKYPILQGFNAADYARKAAAWNDQAIVSDAMSVLQAIYGHKIPQPTSWQITRWALDPFSLCSYSFNAVGANANSRTELAKSMDDRIFFAGEATSRDYPATVHGAYLTGLSAAKAIID